MSQVSGAGAGGGEAGGAAVLMGGLSSSAGVCLVPAQAVPLARWPPWGWEGQPPRSCWASGVPPGTGQSRRAARALRVKGCCRARCSVQDDPAGTVLRCGRKNARKRSAELDTGTVREAVGLPFRPRRFCWAE